MKNRKRLGILCMSLLGLASCADSNIDIFNTQVKPDLARENWMQQVNLDPNIWVRNADSWFLSGKPTPPEKADNTAPYSQAITTMRVRVPDFTALRVSGNLHVQIIGSQEHNSVYIYGPLEAVRQTRVEVHGNSILIHEAKNCSAYFMKQIIVRVGVRNLNKVTVCDNAGVEGKNIWSDALNIKSTSTGETLLAGDMNLMNVNQLGSGAITVMGAKTPSLDINVYSRGTVNISGHVGAHSLINKNGIINIIGADSDSLTITASGASRTAISGYVNLKKVTATGDSRVYAYWVNSNGTYVNEFDRARVGLAGATKSINIDITSSSRFEGKYLHGDNIYVRTRGWSHANVNPTHKMFAAALDNSSIYFFGSPSIVSRYTSSDGIIIPVWNEGTSLPTTVFPPPVQQPAQLPVLPQQVSYKDEIKLK